MLIRLADHFGTMPEHERTEVAGRLIRLAYDVMPAVLRLQTFTCHSPGIQSNFTPGGGNRLIVGCRVRACGMPERTWTEVAWCTDREVAETLLNRMQTLGIIGVLTVSTHCAEAWTIKVLADDVAVARTVWEAFCRFL